MKTTKSVGRLVSCIHRFTAIYFHKKFRPYHIGAGQIPLLMMLYHHEGINQECLAHHLLIDKATCARAIQKLTKQGYVCRHIDDQDKRAYSIHLTEKGHAFQSTARAVLQEWTTTLLTDFTENEKQLVFTLLEKMKKNAQNGIQHLE